MTQYRTLLRRKGILSWSLVRLTTRFPAAAAPIMFVMLTRTELGHYSTGAWMAAACVLTECVAAPVLGARADRHPVASDARISLAVSAAALVALAVGISTLPSLALIALAGVTGGAIAGLIGSLRVLLTRMLSENEIHVGLSWDSVITNLTFAVSPLLVTTLALSIDGRVPLLLSAAGCVFALIWLGRIPGVCETPSPGVTDELRADERRHRRHLLLRVWPIYLTSAAAMFLSGSIEVSASPLFEQSGYDLRWAGVALSGFSIAAVIGGLAYGLKTWPGSYPLQCLVFLVLTCLFTAGATVTDGPLGLSGILVPFAAAGFTQSCLVTARNLSLHQSLSERYLSLGNSLLYSASCISFGLSSAAAGWFADRSATIGYILISCVLTAALAIISAVAEKTRQSNPTRNLCIR